MAKVATAKRASLSPKDDNIPTELHDGVFNVCQVTRGTALEHLVGADLVHMHPGKQSNMHRHNRSETILFITEGSGEILMDENVEVISIVKGDRITIRAGRYHAVRTLQDRLHFLSIQSPPILDEASGTLDLEWLTPR